MSTNCVVLQGCCKFHSDLAVDRFNDLGRNKHSSDISCNPAHCKSTSSERETQLLTRIECIGFRKRVIFPVSGPLKLVAQTPYRGNQNFRTSPKPANKRACASASM